MIAKAKEAVALNNYEEAIRLYNEAATLDKDNPEPYEQLGKLYWEKVFAADGSDLVKATKPTLVPLDVTAKLSLGQLDNPLCFLK